MSNVKVEYDSNVVQFLGKFEELAEASLEEIGAEIQSKAQRKTPVDSGKTKGAWAHKVNGNEVLIGNTEETAIWLELGTGDYAVNHDGRKGGWWVPIGEGSGQISQTTVDKYRFKIGYGKNGMKCAFTRGIKPNRMLHNAVEKSKSKIGIVLQTKLGGVE